MVTKDSSNPSLRLSMATVAAVETAEEEKGETNANTNLKDPSVPEFFFLFLFLFTQRFLFPFTW